MSEEAWIEVYSRGNSAYVVFFSLPDGAINPVGVASWQNLEQVIAIHERSGRKHIKTIALI